MNPIATRLNELAPRLSPQTFWRRIASAAGLSRVTVSYVVRGDRIPKWCTLEAIVVALGGDTAEFQALWQQCKTHPMSTSQSRSSNDEASTQMT